LDSSQRWQRRDDSESALDRLGFYTVEMERLHDALAEKTRTLVDSINKGLAASDEAAANDDAVPLQNNQGGPHPPASEASE